jgi:2-methylcitrate dehydratase PrpD
MAHETRTLAEFLATCRWRDMPEPVRHEATRSLVNWMGCALGSALHPGVQATRRALRLTEGTPSATLLGFHECSDPASAALVNGVSSHVLDFDDTHAAALIHPSAPVLSAALALAEARGASGEALMEAFVVGVEAACRVGLAVLPSHYDLGWHITGTAGGIGAAAACGRLLGLDTERMLWALGIAATQPTGLREHFGSMTKSFHPGRAAQNGLLAALLAEQGFDGAAEPIEGRRGFAAILASGFKPEEMTGELGTRWEILRNTYKPFACGLVIHPAIDLGIQLRAMPGFAVENIAGVALRVHPLVLDLTGKREPASGLEGKFSVFHAGDEEQFSDERVTAPDVVALRALVSATVDPACGPTETEAVVTFKDGTTRRVHTTTPIGSLGNPMSDAALSAKFTKLAMPVLGEAATARLLEGAWGLATAPGLGFLADA